MEEITPGTLPTDALTPKEVAALIQMDPTEAGIPTDVYYAFLFALYTDMGLSELEQLDGDQHFAMTERGLILQYGTRTVLLDEVVDGAPGTICDLYNGIYGQPFFGPIPPRILPVKLKGLFKALGVERKLTVDEDFARRTRTVYFQSLGLTPEEIQSWSSDYLPTQSAEPMLL